MNCPTPTPRQALFAVITVSSFLVCSMFGQSTNRHVGTSFEVTATRDFRVPPDNRASSRCS